MDMIKLYERALRLQRRLSAIDDRLVVGVGTGYCNNEPFMYCSMKGSNDRSIHGLTRMDDNSIIKESKQLLEPIFTPISKLCVDLIGKKVYLNKEKELVVKSITSKTTIEATDGEIYLVKNLYLKD